MSTTDDSGMTPGPEGTDPTTGDEVTMDTTRHDTTWHDTTRHDTEQLGATRQDTEELGSFDWQSEPEEAPRPTLSRPKGPSWGTIALGLISLIVAGGALWVEWADLNLDWTRSGPLALVGLGLVLVLVGLAALVRRGDEDEDLDPRE